MNRIEHIQKFLKDQAAPKLGTTFTGKTLEDTEKFVEKAARDNARVFTATGRNEAERMDHVEKFLKNNAPALFLTYELWQKPVESNGQVAVAAPEKKVQTHTNETGSVLEQRCLDLIAHIGKMMKGLERRVSRRTMARKTVKRSRR